MRSLRFRLIAWNLAVLALSLVLFAVWVGYGSVSRLQADIDRELRQRASRFLERPPGVGIRGPFGGVREAPPPPPGEVPGPLGDLRRPRVYDLGGNLVGPASWAPPIQDQPSLQKALEGTAVYGVVQAGPERFRTYTMPRFGEDGRIVGAVQVVRELRDVDLLLRGQLHTLAVLLPLALLVAGGGAFFLADRALRPIAQLTRAARSITASDLSQRVHVQGDDEFAELARTMNEMIGRLEGSFAEIRHAYAELQAAFERQRQFTADASHELRTPLTRMRLATGAALARDPGPEDRKAIETADAAAAAMSRLVDQLLVLARADAGALAAAMEPVDLRLIASDAVSATSGREIELELAEEPVRVSGDAELLRRVCLNLLENAVRHTPGTAQVRVRVRLEGGTAVLEVSDTGPGIAPEHLPCVFDRFYRADAARTSGGAGLGLAICKSLVEAHRGSMAIESAPGKGTTVAARFPSVLMKTS